MFELLNSGWLAHRYGRKRCYVMAAAGGCMVGFSMAMACIQEVAFAHVSPDTQAPLTLQLVAVGIWLNGTIALFRALWWAYRDYRHQQYTLDAEHYHRHGW